MYQTYAHYKAPELLGCDYEGYHYICIVPLATFYSHILAVAIVAMTSYLLCNIYTLVWIAYPPLLDPFYKVSTRCRIIDMVGLILLVFTWININPVHQCICLHCSS